MRCVSNCSCRAAQYSIWRLGFSASFGMGESTVMPVPVITVAQMREWEKATWASGQTEDAVMRRAGQAVADHAQRLTSPGDRVFVLAGKGHNGQDAKYAAKFLTGREVKIFDVFDPDATLNEFKSAAKDRP